MRFALIILASLVVGALLGAWQPTIGPSVGLLGDLFVAALKALVLPIIFTSVVASMAKLGAAGVGARLGRAFAYFGATMALAVGLGLGLVNAVQPGVSTSGQGQRALAAKLGVSGEPAARMSGMAFAQNQAKKLFQDPIQAWARGNVLGLLIFAVLFGLALGRVPESAVWIELLEGAEGAVGWLVECLLKVTPVGVFGLACAQAANTGLEPLKLLLPYAGVVVGGLLIHALVVLPAVVALFGRRSPRRFLGAAMRPLSVAFATASSAATLPVTLAAAEDDLGIPERTSRVVLPLGATINMDGTALYEAVAALFIAQLYGIDLTAMDQLVVALTACLAAIGAAGIPSAGLVTMALVLTAVDLPLEGIGIVLAIDRLLDMVRTAVNVLGDLGGAVVVDAQSGE
jgi:proton glutamate symport protein